MCRSVVVITEGLMRDGGGKGLKMVGVWERPINLTLLDVVVASLKLDVVDVMTLDIGVRLTG